MAAAFDAPPELLDSAAEFAEAALYHAGLIDWSVRQTRRFPVRKVIADLRGLNETRTQEALDAMIHVTMRQMVETEAKGAVAEAILRRLAVCQGGFTYDAAQAICRETPEALDDALNTLQSWQFLRFEGQRYALDPLAAAVIAPDSVAYRPHYDFYLALAREHDRRQDYLGLDIESDNLDAAFEWAIANGDGEDALWLANACGHFLGNRGRFEQRLNWFERVAAALAAHPDDMLRANAQNSLGLIYQEHPTGSKRDNLQRAIAAYEAALIYYTPQAAPLDYAMTQNNLGNAYRDLAGIEDRAANLQRAIAAYEAALQYWTPEPRRWATPRPRTTWVMPTGAWPGSRSAPPTSSAPSPPTKPRCNTAPRRPRRWITPRPRTTWEMPTATWPGSRTALPTSSAPSPPMKPHCNTGRRRPRRCITPRPRTTWAMPTGTWPGSRTAPPTSSAPSPPLKPHCNTAPRRPRRWTMP